MPAGPTGWKPVLTAALLAALALLPALALADPLDEVRQALAESIPLVAAVKAERVLAAPELTAEQKDDATFLLARAQFEMGQAEEALTRMRPLIAVGYPGAALLQAHLLASQGKWKEAQAAYHPLSAAPGAPAEAWIGEAEALHALGRDEAALALFQSASRALGAPAALQLRVAALQVETGHLSKAETLLANLRVTTPEERKWKEYVEGRLLLLRDQAAPALTIFEEVLKNRENLPESLLVAATFGATDARIALYGSARKPTACSRRSSGATPPRHYLDQVFRRLDQVYGQEDDAPEAEYQRWASKSQVHRATLARFYLAKLQYRQRKIDRATESFEAFIRSLSGRSADRRGVPALRRCAQPKRPPRGGRAGARWRDAARGRRPDARGNRAALGAHPVPAGRVSAGRDAIRGGGAALGNRAAFRHCSMRR